MKMVSIPQRQHRKNIRFIFLIFKLLIIIIIKKDMKILIILINVKLF